MATPKLTFQESRQEIQAVKNNSDLANLAHALEYVQVARKELDDLELAINRTAQDIEAGTVQSYETIDGLYRKAKSCGIKL